MAHSGTLTKANIVEQLYTRVKGFSKKEAVECVEVVFESLKKILEKGESLKISRFGKFVVRDKKERVGRDPQRGGALKISARRVVGFKPSQLLKSHINHK